MRKLLIHRNIYTQQKHGNTERMWNGKDPDLLGIREDGWSSSCIPIMIIKIYIRKEQKKRK